jgi:hypothetical protein
MNDAQTEIFRKDILNALLASEPNIPGLDVSSIWVGVRSLGHTKITPAETLEHIEYLQQKGFIAEVEKKISKAHRCWRITDEGRRLLD